MSPEGDDKVDGGNSNSIRFKINLWELKWRINLTINLKIGGGLGLT